MGNSCECDYQGSSYEQCAKSDKATQCDKSSKCGKSSSCGRSSSCAKSSSCGKSRCNKGEYERLTNAKSTTWGAEIDCCSQWEVKKTLKKIPGVEKVKYNRCTKELTVTGNASEVDVEKALANQGIDATRKPSPSSA